MRVFIEDFTPCFIEWIEFCHFFSFSFFIPFGANQKTERLYKKKKPCQGVEARKYIKNAEKKLKTQKAKKI